MNGDKDCKICHGQGWYITRVVERSGKVMDVFTAICNILRGNDSKESGK